RISVGQRHTAISREELLVQGRWAGGERRRRLLDRRDRVRLQPASRERLRGDVRRGRGRGNRRWWQGCHHHEEWQRRPRHTALDEPGCGAEGGARGSEVHAPALTALWGWGVVI